jgi:hypothetical protein
VVVSRQFSPRAVYGRTINASHDPWVAGGKEQVMDDDRRQESSQDVPSGAPHKPRHILWLASLASIALLAVVAVLQFKPAAAPPSASAGGVPAPDLPVTLRGQELLDTRVFKLARSGTDRDKLRLSEAQAADAAALQRLPQMTIPLSSQPLQVEWLAANLTGEATMTGDGRLVCTTEEHLYLFAHDGAPQAAWSLGADTTGDRTYPLAVSPSAMAYVSNSQDQLVAVNLDSGRSRVLQRIGLPLPQWIGIAPDGGLVVTAQRAADQPAFIDLLALTSQGQVRWRHPLPYLSGQPAVDARGRVFVQREAGQMPGTWQWSMLAADGRDLRDFKLDAVAPPVIADDGASFWLEQTAPSAASAPEINPSGVPSGRTLSLTCCELHGEREWSQPLGQCGKEALPLLVGDQVEVLGPEETVLCFDQQSGKQRWKLAGAGTGRWIVSTAGWPGGSLWLTELPAAAGELAHRAVLLFVAPDGQARQFLMPVVSGPSWVTPTHDYLLVSGPAALAWPAGITPPAAQ